MTKESLQKYCDDRGLKIKILHIVPPNSSSDAYKEYEVIYTFNLNYRGRDYFNVHTLVEPERDEMCTDEEEFYLFICTYIESLHSI